MMPIVNGLEEGFRDKVQFEYLNAADNAAGQKAFEALNLPGHPSYVIFSSDGKETYRSFGVVIAGVLETAITASLDKSLSTAEP